MLTIYLACLLVGGGLIALTLALGGDGDVHAGADAGADGEAHAEGFLSALPFASLTFWTFFCAFFGLAGLALTWLGAFASALAVGGAAAFIGFASGTSVVQLIRRLRRHQTDSSVRAEELIGQLGTVLLPVGKAGPGKVRVPVKGRLVDLIAHADDDPPLCARQSVVVHDVLEDGAVRVVAADAGGNPKSPEAR